VEFSVVQERQETKLSPYTGLALVLIILMIGGSSYGIYRLVKIIRKPAKYTDILMCDHCGHIFEKEHTAEERYPFTCEKCGEKQAYMAFICTKCGRIFPHVHPGSDERIECPNCFSPDVKPLLYVPPKETETESMSEQG